MDLTTPKKIGPQCALGVLCFMLVCFYFFRLEFCFQMSVSGSLTAASEKVDKLLCNPFSFSWYTHSPTVYHSKMLHN